MPAFITNLPLWAIILIAAVLAYIGYRYWQYKKSTAYAPNIARGTDVSLRDNPASTGNGG